MDQAKIEHHGDELYTSLVDRKPVDPRAAREPSIMVESACWIRPR